MKTPTTKRRSALASPASAAPRTKIGLALAGGGPLGGVYELGALIALAEALEGLDFNQADVFVGVSSGSFLAAALANGITPAEMYWIFIENQSVEHPLTPDVFLKPAFREYARGLGRVPGILMNSVASYVREPFERGLWDSVGALGRALPTGVFDNESIHHYLARLFAAPGRSNDFRELPRPLYVVATNLDTGNAIEFGAPGADHVPISKAVQASSALPGLYPPVKIDGEYYVDGVLERTLHASVAFEHGAELVLCVNPLVPFDADLASARGRHHVRKLVNGGLPSVLSQTIRAVIHSRMRIGINRYRRDFAHADLILFEPGRDDAQMFFANPLSYANRKRVCQHAYQRTRAMLAERSHELEPILARHGIRYRYDVLADPRRKLSPVPPSVRSRLARKTATQSTARTLDETLARLEHWLGAAPAKAG